MTCKCLCALLLRVGLATMRTLALYVILSVAALPFGVEALGAERKSAAEETNPRPADLSSAMQRYRTYWNGAASLDRNNEFFTAFKYTHVRGLGPEQGVSRRDPSTIIKIADTYYVWYTKYQGPLPIGVKHAEEVSETVPLPDWDLAALKWRPAGCSSAPARAAQSQNHPWQYPV